METRAADAKPPQAVGLRERFPVLAQHAYLNAGTDGPLPAAAVQAARAELERELEGGRTGAHFERRRQLQEDLRSGYAGVLGAGAENVALTTCTSEGLQLVIAGLELAPGDEILTSDEEHPGLLGALQYARDVRGVRVRSAPFRELHEAVGPRTRLVACSHVSWVSGAIAPAALAAAAADAPVLLDGAQGVGAVELDVAALGCAAYAGAGQKWLCGPDGTGMLYVSPALRERLAVTRRGYSNLENPEAGLEARLRADGGRFDAFALSAETLACALASVEVLAATGWQVVHARARALAARLAERLTAAGRAVLPRDATTLVTFSSPDAAGEREELAAAGVIVRDIPGRGMLRASVGAWNDERDIDRLLAGLRGG